MRGLSSNLLFLENVIAHPLFLSGECTTRFIDETPELFKVHKRRDRATRLLRFLGEREGAETTEIPAGRVTLA